MVSNRKGEIDHLVADLLDICLVPTSERSDSPSLVVQRRADLSGIGITAHKLDGFVDQLLSRGTLARVFPAPRLQSDARQTDRILCRRAAWAALRKAFLSDQPNEMVQIGAGQRLSERGS